MKVLGTWILLHHSQKEAKSIVSFHKEVPDRFHALATKAHLRRHSLHPQETFKINFSLRKIQEKYNRHHITLPGKHMVASYSL
jgi:hypothetical protein